MPEIDRHKTRVVRNRRQPSSEDHYRGSQRASQEHPHPGWNPRRFLAPHEAVQGSQGSHAQAEDQKAGCGRELPGNNFLNSSINTSPWQSSVARQWQTSHVPDKSRVSCGEHDQRATLAENSRSLRTSLLATL